MPNCCVCQESLGDRNELEIHLASFHVFYSPYRCEYCQTAQFPTDHALRQHYQIDHRQAVFNVKYRVSPDLDKKRQQLEILLQRSMTSAEAVEDQEDVQNGELAFLMNGNNGSGHPANQSLDPVPSFGSQHQLVKHDVSDSEASSLFFTPPRRAVKNMGRPRKSVQNGATASILGLNQSAIQPSCSIANHSGLTEGDATTPDDKNLNNFLAMLYNNGNGKSEIDAEIGGMEANNFILNPMEEEADKQAPSLLGKRKYGKKSAGGVQAQFPPRLSAAAENDEIAEGIEPLDESIKPKLQCIGCHRKVSDYVNSLLLHISTHHYEAPIYECLGCGKEWHSLSARTREHMNSKHDGDMSLLKDNRKELMGEIKEKAAQLFPGRRLI